MRKTRSKRFKGWDKVKIVNDHGIEKEAIAPVIISASWRTDITSISYEDKGNLLLPPNTMRQLWNMDVAYIKIY